MYDNDRPDVVGIVPREVRSILDVGCATGRLGAALKAERALYVAGIDVDAEAVSQARARLDCALQVDVDSEELPFPAESFDCLLYADILEHLQDPWRVLAAQRRLLKPGGYMIASIPNVRYWRVVRDLACGRWDYTCGGVCDQGHVRFFTLDGMRRLVRGAGYEIAAIRRHPILGKSRLLNRATRGKLSDVLTWRYVLIGRNGMAPLVPGAPGDPGYHSGAVLGGCLGAGDRVWGRIGS